MKSYWIVLTIEIKTALMPCREFNTKKLSFLLTLSHFIDHFYNIFWVIKIRALVFTTIIQLCTTIDYSLKKVQKTILGLDMNGTHQVLAYNVSIIITNFLIIFCYFFTRISCIDFRCMFNDFPCFPSR